MSPADGERWSYVRSDGHLPSDKEPEPDNTITLGEVVRLLGGVAYFPGDTAAQDTVREWCAAYDTNPDGYYPDDVVADDDVVVDDDVIAPPLPPMSAPPSPVKKAAPAKTTAGTKP